MLITLAVVDDLEGNFDVGSSPKMSSNSSFLRFVVMGVVFAGVGGEVLGMFVVFSVVVPGIVDWN